MTTMTHDDNRNSTNAVWRSRLRHRWRASIPDERCKDRLWVSRAYCPVFAATTLCQKSFPHRSLSCRE